MTFLGLYIKLGKQPIHNTRTSEIIAVFNKEDLLKLIKDSNGVNISIPLNIKFGNGKQKMWFVEKKSKI